MSTWTYVLTTNIGKVRLLIGDTDIDPITDAQFSDEEIQVFLDTHSNNINLASAMALGAWIGALTRELKSEKIGDYSYTRDTIANMNKLKKELEATDASTPYFTWSEGDLTGGSTITTEED